MTIHFDQTKPIYLQVAQMIRDSVISGDLSEDSSIPSVRRISVDQGLNPQTVLNATHALVDEGILEKRRGVGIFVKRGARELLRQRELNQLQQHEVPEMVTRARLLGLTVKETVQLVRDNFKEQANG
ncbi:MAG: GntR family transcriptional regulator [Candidatus Neomarinimicrobiota bacterium]